MEKNTKNTIKENIGIKITKKTNIFFKKYSCISFLELERIHSWIKIVLTSILWMSNKDSSTSFLSSLQMYNHFRYQLQSFLVKICIKNNNGQIISLPLASRLMNCTSQICFINMYCNCITLKQIYFCDNRKLVIKKFNTTYINNCFF
jgi:hypothetical protein